MHPDAAGLLADKVGVVAFNREVVDRVAALVPLDLNDLDRWPCPCDNGVANRKPARRNKAY